MRRDMKTIKTRYLVIAAAAILAGSAAATAWVFTHARGGSNATVYVDGEPVKTVDIDRMGEYLIETKYGYNRICTEGGRVWVEDADCPDKLCVGMGARNNDLAPIACLPHHLVIQVEGNGADSVDAVAGVAP